jgi:hypothetical protein
MTSRRKILMNTRKNQGIIGEERKENPPEKGF